MKISFRDDDLITEVSSLLATAYNLLYLSPESSDKRYKPIMKVIQEIGIYYETVYGVKLDKQLNLFEDC